MSCAVICDLVVFEIVCKDMLCILMIRGRVLGISWLKLDKCCVLAVSPGANMYINL